METNNALITRIFYVNENEGYAEDVCLYKVYISSSENFAIHFIFCKFFILTESEFLHFDLKSTKRSQIAIRLSETSKASKSGIFLIGRLFLHSSELYYNSTSAFCQNHLKNNIIHIRRSNLRKNLQLSDFLSN